MKKTILRDCLSMAHRLNNPQHPSWGNYHHFTFVISKNKIIEYGVNRRMDIGSMKVRGYEGFSNEHSEVNAWRKARGLVREDKFEIVNIRLNRDGTLRNSKPCNCCFNFLKELNCGIAYFTTDLGFSKISVDNRKEKLKY